MNSTVTCRVSIFIDRDYQSIGGLTGQAGGSSWMMDELGDNELGEGNMGYSTGLDIREARAEKQDEGKEHTKKEQKRHLETHFREMDTSRNVLK